MNSNNGSTGSSQRNKGVSKRGPRAKRGRRYQRQPPRVASSPTMQSHVAVSSTEEFSTMHNNGTVDDTYNNGHEAETNGKSGPKDLLYDELFGDVVEKVEKRAKPGPKSKKTKRVPLPQPTDVLDNIFEQVEDVQQPDPVAECPDPEPIEKVKSPKSKKSKRVLDPEVLESPDFESVDNDQRQEDLAQTELDEVTDNMIGEELDRSFHAGDDDVPLQIDETEDIPPQAEDMLPQTEDIPPLVEDPPEEMEEMLPETEQIIPEIEEEPLQTEQIADLPQSVLIEDITDTHVTDHIEESSAYIDTEPSVVLANDSESDDQPSVSSAEVSFHSVVEPEPSNPAAETRPAGYVPFISARRPLYSATTRSNIEPVEPSCSVFSFLRQSPSAPSIKRKADESMDREPKRTKSEGFFSLFATPVLDRLRGKARAVVEDDSLDEGIVLDAGDLSGVGPDDVVGKEELPANIHVAEPARNWCVLM